MVPPLSCLIWVTLNTQSKINDRDFTTNSIFKHDYGPMCNDDWLLQQLAFNVNVELNTLKLIKYILILKETFREGFNRGVIISLIMRVLFM